MSTGCLLFLFLSVEFFYRLGATASTNKTIERSKREFVAKYLVFPQGSNVQLVYCLTVSTYAKPAGFFTLGVTAGQAWELPYESMVSRKNLAESYHRRSRRDLYRKLELLLETRGKDGRACVLKAICKASGRNSKDVGEGSFLEELLHAVFRLPEGFAETDSTSVYENTFFRRENCGEMEDRCPDVF